MNRKLNVTLALAAGLLGGLLSRYITPTPVFAQVQAPVPKEIRAQRFVLVNDQGVPLGVFGFDREGVPTIKLIDQSGRTIWSTQETVMPSR